MYVTSLVTVSTEGLQPANVYVYSFVAAFVGSFGFSISAAAVPYSYSFSALSTVVPSSSTNLTLYLFFTADYVAMYIASHVTSSTAGLHPANVYVNSAVAALVGLTGFSISAAAVPYS